MSVPRKALGSVSWRGVTTGKALRAVPPGEILQADFIEPLGLTRYRVAQAIGVQQRRIDEVCSGRRAVTADTALRLGLAFGVPPQFWLNLQAQYDIEIVEREQGEVLLATVQPLAA
jgi:antitoxin HigA-1